MGIPSFGPGSEHEVPAGGTADSPAHDLIDRQFLGVDDHPGGLDPGQQRALGSNRFDRHLPEQGLQSERQRLLDYVGVDRRMLGQESVQLLSPVEVFEQPSHRDLTPGKDRRTLLNLPGSDDDQMQCAHPVLSPFGLPGRAKLTQAAWQRSPGLSSFATMAVLVEACVESEALARRAIDAGAGRLELCRELRHGGTTPGVTLLERVRRLGDFPLHVMIRPRAGSFCYNEAEVQQMVRDIERARRIGAQGVVFGALVPDGRIDQVTTSRLRDAAGSLSVTFHRAFDQTPDPHRALAQLIKVGIDRVLTAGHAPRAELGIPVLAELVRLAGARITILAGGGVRADHARELVKRTGVTELHLRPGPRAAWLSGVIAAVS